MRILPILLVSVVAGISIGAAVAYVEVRSDAPKIDAFTGQPISVPSLDADAKVPRIEIDEPNFKFGVMEKGKANSHEFHIRNVGTAPLKLLAGEPSCKCTRFELADTTVQPGESTVVYLEWDAKSDRGPFRQHAPISTNDPLHSQIELSIEGEIVEAKGVMPSDFVFDKIAFGETKSAEVYVMAMLQDTLKVTSAELSDTTTRDNFDVRIEPVTREALPDKAAHDGVKITLTAKPGLPVGRFNQWLTLRTNLEGSEKLDIAVIGRVFGDISVHGTTWNEEQGVLMIGKVKSSEGAKAKVNLVVRGAEAANTKFEVQSIDPPELKVRIGEPKQYKETLLHVPVEIEVPAGTRPMVRLNTAQGDEGRIVLKTTGSKMKEVVLGVRFTVER